MKSDHEVCHKCDKNNLPNAKLAVHIKVTHIAHVGFSMTLNHVSFQLLFPCTGFITNIAPTHRKIFWS